MQTGLWVADAWRALWLPHWWLLAGTAVLPALWLWRRREQRCRRAGCCPQCGYDLRGNPAAPACPECGALTAPAPVQGTDTRR